MWLLEIWEPLSNK